MNIRDEHFRAPLLWLLAPYMAGLLAARVGLDVPGRVTTVVCIAVAAFALIASFRTGPQARRIWTACLFVAGFGGGAANMQRALDLQPRWEDLPAREATLEVEVTRVFPLSTDSNRRSCLGRVVGASVPIDDLIGQRVYFAVQSTDESSPFLRSTVARVNGILTPLVSQDIERQSFDAYLLSSGIGFRLDRARVLSISGRALFFPQLWDRLGQRFDRILQEGLPKQNPAVGAYLAMFLGRKSELSLEQKEYFLRSGTMHLFAISGLHIGIIALCLHSLIGLTRLPRPVVAAIGLLCLWAFVESTGGTPSARRALLMIAFVWIGHGMKRPSNPLSSLIASALFLLVWDPLALLSTSFQLSYTVVLSILLYGLPLNNAWQRKWHPFRFLPESEWLRWQRLVFFAGKQLISFASISVSAATVSIPLGLAYFGVASPGAVVSNIMVIPFAMAAVGAGFASIVFGLLGVAILSSVFNHAAVLIISVIDMGAQWASAVPGMFFHGSFSQEWMSPAIVLVLTAVMVALYAVGWRRVPGGLWIPPALMAGALVLLVTPGQPDHQSVQMKSAYELAMERLQKSDPDADVKLTEEQKAQLADVTRVYEGKLAEREIFLKQRLAEARSAGNAEDFESISKQLVSERARLEEEREDAKNEIRRAGKKT